MGHTNAQTIIKEKKNKPCGLHYKVVNLSKFHIGFDDNIGPGKLILAVIVSCILMRMSEVTKELHSYSSKSCSRGTTLKRATSVIS